MQAIACFGRVYGLLGLHFHTGKRIAGNGASARPATPTFRASFHVLPYACPHGMMALASVNKVVITLSTEAIQSNPK